MRMLRTEDRGWVVVKCLKSLSRSTRLPPCLPHTVIAHSRPRSPSNHNASYRTRSFLVHKLFLCFSHTQVAVLRDVTKQNKIYSSVRRLIRVVSAGNPPNPPSPFLPSLSPLLPRAYHSFGTFDRKPNLPFSLRPSLSVVPLFPSFPSLRLSSDFTTPRFTNTRQQHHTTRAITSVCFFFSLF